MCFADPRVANRRRPRQVEDRDRSGDTDGRRSLRVHRRQHVLNRQALF